MHKSGVDTAPDEIQYNSYSLNIRYVQIRGCCSSFAMKKCGAVNFNFLRIKE